MWLVSNLCTLFLQEEDATNASQKCITPAHSIDHHVSRCISFVLFTCWYARLDLHSGCVCGGSNLGIPRRRLSVWGHDNAWSNPTQQYTRASFAADLMVCFRNSTIDGTSMVHHSPSARGCGGREETAMMACVGREGALSPDCASKCCL